MIYKNELLKLSEEMNLSLVDISKICGWSGAYLTANMKDHPDPLSIKVSSRLYFYLKKECEEILPAQRIWVIKEYINSAIPKPILDEQNKEAKVISKLKKKMAKDKLKLKNILLKNLEDELKESKKAKKTKIIKKKKSTRKKVVTTK